MEGFLNPIQVLSEINLLENAIAADLGCGAGGWVIPLSRKLNEGIVYAVDILEEPLSALKSRAEAEGLSNIQILRSDIEGPRPIKIPDGTCDLVLMTNLFFQLENREKGLSEAKRILKKGGRILIVDWKKESVLGPKTKVSVEDVKKIGESMGLAEEKKFDAGVYHWALVLVK